MSNSDYCFDPWVIRKLETDDMGHENWDDADSVDFFEDDDDEESDDGEIEEEDFDDDDE